MNLRRRDDLTPEEFFYLGSILTMLLIGAIL